MCVCVWNFWNFICRNNIKFGYFQKNVKKLVWQLVSKRVYQLSVCRPRCGILCSLHKCTRGQYMCVMASSTTAVRNADFIMCEYGISIRHFMYLFAFIMANSSRCERPYWQLVNTCDHFQFWYITNFTKLTYRNKLAFCLIFVGYCRRSRTRASYISNPYIRCLKSKWREIIP